MAGSRVTMKQVAREAGVHVTTVSLALRNSSQLPPATRERIQAIAARLGYRPDPHLTALSAYRQTLRPPGFQATLAWITNHPTSNGWRVAPQFVEYHAGAHERANQLGYALEELWLRAPGMTSARINQILRAKNITGVLLAPQPAPNQRVDLDWSRYCAVTFGYGLREPRLATVSNHQYHSGLRAVSELLDLGYNRIGLLISPDHETIIDHQYSSAYYGAMERRNCGNRIPVLFMPQTDELDRQKRTFLEWMDAFRPDVILTMPYYNMRELIGATGLRVPEDLGLAYLNLIGSMKDGSLAGMAEPSRDVGAAAVDHLVAMVNHDRRGIPLTQNLILVESQWMQGASVQRSVK